MRVLLANKFFFRNGGSEVVMFQERDYLVKHGIKVIDFSMSDSRNLHSQYAEFFVRNRDYGGASEGKIGRVLAAASLVYSREAAKKIGRLIESTNPDVLHCHNVYHQLTPSIILEAKRRNLPVVLTLHDYKIVCPVYTRLRHGELCSECLGGNFGNLLKHRCADGSLVKSAVLYTEARLHQVLKSYDQVDLFLAPSHFMAESVSRHRVPRDKVRILRNGVDTRRIVPCGIDKGYALYIGRLSAEKGVQTLLEAHARMKKVPLMVAGTGPLEGELRKRYPAAQFVGHLTGDALRRAISEAGMVVVPSEWYENAPMSVLEAMAYRKAVVASDIGGIPEIVQHGETGFLFPPGDCDALKQCVEELVDVPSKRAQFGAAGRSRVETLFSADAHNRELMRIYAELVGRGGERRLDS